MIAALKSGSGKTLITCGLLKHLKDKGLDVVSFKCGPDYIDPMFHKKVLGIDGRNLDTYFSGTEGVKRIVAEVGKKYAVMEGVMGIYDGMKADSLEGSCYEASKVTKTPVILIADASSCGRTIISLIKGVLHDDTDCLIKGIILNRISSSFYDSLKDVLIKEIRASRSDVELLGFFPKNPELSIESRHLGLRLPKEIDLLREKIEKSAKVLGENIETDKIIRIMENAENLYIDLKENVAFNDKKKKVNLAVAYDEAFCFYYKDNLDLFRENGVEIEFFSPLWDKTLPKDADGILLGGGYPELYLDRLSKNTSMLSSIRCAIENNVPSLAECGGFMYLHKSVADTDGNEYEMVGAIDGKCSFSGHLVRFGYMKINSANEDAFQDELFGSLIGMKGHEFHYYDSSINGEAFVAGKPDNSRMWKCMITENNGIWGFPHFYYRSDPEFVLKFIDRMSGKK